MGEIAEGGYGNERMGTTGGGLGGLRGIVEIPRFDVSCVHDPNINESERQHLAFVSYPALSTLQLSCDKVAGNMIILDRRLPMLRSLPQHRNKKTSTC